MSSKWRKAKIALGQNLCIYVPGPPDDMQPSLVDTTARISNASSLSPVEDRDAFSSPKSPSTPIPSSSGLRLPRAGSRSSKRTCAICLGTMKPGHGHAIFTAECSHAFHFHCIASSVKYGNQICPVCRAAWKEVPFQGPSLDTNGRVGINSMNWPQDESWMNVLHQLPPARARINRQLAPLFRASPEPTVFNDDEPLDPQSELPDEVAQYSDNEACEVKTVEIKTYPEFSPVSRATSHEKFDVLIHLKAPFRSFKLNSGGNPTTSAMGYQTSRAPVDLVTVLDISGSMAGTKLALLKRAMGFVIQNLGPADRLCVIAFSSTARRLFPLQRMSESGRQLALQAVNSLISNGGTNIAEGLRKGVKVIEERKDKNPVCSIILLSDGQDTYTVSGSGARNLKPDYRSLLPYSIRGGMGRQIPVHAFGFGMDHDAASMHSISETSGGTFSFIEAEAVIQDAFAQCIGGLLSVVVQELRVGIECVQPGISIHSIRAGSYTSCLLDDALSGYITVGDLYADEERDFLVSVNIPVSDNDSTRLIKVSCGYEDPISKEKVELEAQEVQIHRPENACESSVSIDVDRQRNRLQAAEAMAEARARAEQGDLGNAVSVLECCRRALSESAAAQFGDQLCASLDAELKEMQERMSNRRVYEASGRAYVLSGLSSHSWQRATARGNSTESDSLVHAYQTPFMVDMLARSQALGHGGRNHSPSALPPPSFPMLPQPR